MPRPTEGPVNAKVQQIQQERDANRASLEAVRLKLEEVRVQLAALEARRGELVAREGELDRALAAREVELKVASAEAIASTADLLAFCKRIPGTSEHHLSGYDVLSDDLRSVVSFDVKGGQLGSQCAVAVLPHDGVLRCSRLHEGVPSEAFQGIVFHVERQLTGAEKVVDHSRRVEWNNVDFSQLSSAE